MRRLTRICRPSNSPWKRQVAVYEAHKAGKLTQPHAIGLQGIKNGVHAGPDSIDHGIFLDEEAADLMKAKGIYYVPTFGPFYYYTEKRLAEPRRCERADPIIPRHVESFKLALTKGLKVAMGCDSGAPSRFPNGENALEFWLMVRYGMDPMQAIIAGTSNAATLLRRDRPRRRGTARSAASEEPSRSRPEPITIRSNIFIA